MLIYDVSLSIIGHVNEYQRTVKLDITDLLSDYDAESIVGTIGDAYRIFELFVRLGIEHKSTSYNTMHKYGYEPARELCPSMNTALLQQTAKTALSNMKAWNRKNPKKKWKYTGSKHSTSYALNKLSLSQRGNLFTFSTNRKRVRICTQLPAWFDARYPEKSLQAGTVILRNHRFYLNLVYRVRSDIQHPAEEKVVGIDRGIYHPVATSEGYLFSSKEIRATQRRYAFNKKMLQQKGTRSAKRHLKALSGREKRFKADCIHTLTAALTRDESVSIYVLEDLTGLINPNTPDNLERGVKKTWRSKKTNTWLHQWVPYLFEQFLTYKSEARGIEVVKVSPEYTSQRCSKCGTIASSSRNKNHYHCSVCGHTEHADINAAKNIRDRYLLTLAGETGRFQPSERVAV